MFRVLLKATVVCAAVLLIFPAIACGGGGSNVTPPPPPPTTTYTLTVNTSNPTSNVAITISPSDNSGNGNGTSGTLTRKYNSGTTVTLTAPTTSGTNTFDSWQGCTSKNASVCTVTLTKDTTVTGYYVSPTPTAWNLTWSDEFSGISGSAPDTTKWGYDIGVGTPDGWGNGELECYTNSTSNAYLDGSGNLVIQPLSSPGACNGAKNYTSARLLTKSTFSQTYGRIEAKMTLPFGAGIWPAFWMMGTNIDTVSWPACGEMDIMESVPSFGRSVIQSTVHGPNYNAGNGISNKFNFPTGQTIDGQPHVYGVIWGPNKIQFYVDDYTNPFAAVTPGNMPSTGTWAFNDHPFFLIMNVAVGGGWPGPPDSTTFTTPQKMVVDYVRVYTDSNTVSR